MAGAGESAFEQTVQLVRRAQADDGAAMNELFARYLPRVRQITALRLGRRPHELLDVDDITQEALADAFRNIDKFDAGSDGKFCSWLSMLVKNRIRMALRAGRTEKRGGGKVARIADQHDTMRASQIAGYEATPSAHARASEADEEMEKAVMELPENYRELILQRYYCQMSYSEMIETLDYETTNAVRAAYSRALQMLRDKMPSFGEDA